MSTAIESMGAAAYTAVRGVLKAVHVRHNGNVYAGTAARSSTADGESLRLGERDTGDGAARLLVSELVQPIPAVPDMVEVSTDGQTWRECRVNRVRDERNGTIVVEYGGQYS